MEKTTVLAQLCQMSHATTLQQICDQAYEILGNPIFIKDMAHTTLAYTQTVEIEDEMWKNAVIEARADRSTISQAREVNVIHEASAGSRMPVIVTDGVITYPRIIKALSSGGQNLGVMVLTAYLQPLGPEDIALVELISGYAIALIVKEQRGMITGQRSVENYFIKLLDGARPDRVQAEKRLAAVGYQSCASNYVLSICPEEQTLREDSEDLRIILQDFYNLSNCHTFLYNSALVCVYGSEKDIQDWETEAPDLTELLRRWELTAGVSRRITGMENLKEFYVQSQETLAIGHRLKRQFRYYHYDNLSSFLLFSKLPEKELNLYCHQKIQELGEYDRTHNTELCATLQVYLEQTKSLVRTAEILFIHRNTVRYRINKCEELLGTKLEDGNEIFSYILSLRLLEYEAKFLNK